MCVCKMTATIFLLVSSTFCTLIDLLHGSPLTNNILIEVQVGKPLTYDFQNGDDSVLYCNIIRPDGTPYETVFTGNCVLNLNKVTNADSGDWNVKVGFKNSQMEFLYIFSLTIKDWYLDTGISSSSFHNSTSLYCNLKGSLYELVACRFVHGIKNITLHLEDGLGSSSYYYHGTGISNNECGLTIASPDESDYDKWICSLLVKTSDNEYKKITSLITRNENVDDSEPGSNLTELFVEEQTNSTINVVMGTSGKIFCSVPQSLNQCTLISPSGHIFVGDKNYVLSGECGVQIETLSEEHDGVWSCVMITSSSNKVLNHNVNVHVTNNYIAATKGNLSVNLGNEAILLCQSILPLTSLSNCIFQRPNNDIFLITNDYETKNFKYEGVGLEYGDCGLMIKHIEPDDIGEWKCMSFVDVNAADSVFGKASIFVEVAASEYNFPLTLVVEEGSSVSIEMEKMSNPLKACSLIWPDGHETDLPEHVYDQVMYWGLGYQLGQCGALIRNLSSSDKYEKWSVKATDVLGNQYTTAAFVAVTDPYVAVRNITLEVELGSMAEFSCSNSFIKARDYCIIIPPGEDRADHNPGSCSVSISSVRSTHLGAWTCINGIKYSPREMISYINVIEKSPIISISVEGKLEVGSTVTLKCNSHTSLTFCHFIHPTENKVFEMNSGLTYDQFSYAGQSLTKGDCGITISPINYTDFGSWTCNIGWEAFDIQKVLSSKVLIAIKEQELNNDREIIAVLGSQTSVQCETNTSLDYCWIQHPNGTHLVPKRHINSLLMGKCELTIHSIQQDDEGVWKCHMGNKLDPGTEILSEIKILVKDSGLFAASNSIVAEIGTTVLLTCRSVPAGYSLKYCRFIGPNNKNIPVFPNVTSGRYQYYGEGLENGECGIQISPVEINDIGKWECHAQLNNNLNEAYDKIHLTGQGMGIASIAGITVGAAIAVIVIVSAVIMNKKLRKRKNAMQSASFQVEYRVQSVTSSNCSSEEFAYT